MSAAVVPVTIDDADAAVATVGARLLTATSVNSTRLSRVAASLVLASPTRALEPMGIVMLPTSVQVDPSADHEPVNRVPARTTLIHAGAAWVVGPATTTPDPPTFCRYCHAMPLAAETTIAACLALSAVDSRITTPALAQSPVFSTEVTRATMEPSPTSGWEVNRNESAAPPMAVPLPTRMNFPDWRPVAPSPSTLPTSIAVHGSGSAAAAGAAVKIVGEGFAAIVPLRATTR